MHIFLRVLYLVSPFIVGGLFNVLIDIKTDENFYWFWVAISCILSFFAYMKFIAPNLEWRRNTALNIDGNLGLMEHQRQKKDLLGWIPIIHILFFVALVVGYFV